MNTKDKVAVCSRSFANNAVLRAEMLERYQHVTFNDSGKILHGDVLIEFLRGHDKAITSLETVDEAVLRQLPELKVISKYGVGLDSVDIAAVRAHGKRLGWTGGVNRRSVSELVIAFAISLLRHIPAASIEVKAGGWRPHVGGLLSNRTVGIIGCGHVGKDLVKLLQPFECRILVNDIRDYKDFYEANGLMALPLDELLARADIVTLHVPLDESTTGMLDARRLALMKGDALLINTARGGLVDESALKQMLKDGRIAAAAMDVFAGEPPRDMELLGLTNFLGTPHIGGSAYEAILAMGRAAIEGLDNASVPAENFGC